MEAGDALGQVEFAVLDAVNRGALRSRCTARKIRVLGEQPVGEVTLHEVLRRCEREGLLSSHRDRSGRRYELTGAGRAQLQANRRFRALLARAFARSSWSPGSGCP